MEEFIASYFNNDVIPTPTKRGSIPPQASKVTIFVAFEACGWGGTAFGGGEYSVRKILLMIILSKFTPSGYFAVTIGEGA